MLNDKHDDQGEVFRTEKSGISENQWTALERTFTGLVRLIKPPVSSIKCTYFPDAKFIFKHIQYKWLKSIKVLE